MALPPLVATFLLLFLIYIAAVDGQTRAGFYSRSCPRAEIIVRNTVQSHFQTDSTVAPALLRMHFHDCFVRGCDASILLNGSSSEKTAPPNLGVRGYEVIDDAKNRLEIACPGVVSCADILALAARDSVVLSNGPSWSVPTGRRDGTVSLASEVNLPSPLDTVEVQKQKFTAKGLTTRDLVSLVGAHTIGTTACQFFRYRMYNFTGNGDSDPSINPSFLSQMKRLCPQNGDGTTRVALDTGSVSNFDISFFRNVQNGRGILESDQRLWNDSTTQPLVRRFLGILPGVLGLRFNVEFVASMLKMSNVEVNTGSQGEVRKVCSAVN